MHTLSQVLYSATATATGGRAGTAKSSDGVLDVVLTTPKELGGDGARGTNPEQMFAAGYSACFIGAMKHVAMMNKIALPKDTSITGTVGIGPIAQGFCINAKLQVHVPGMDKAAVQDLVNKAHQVCPYSNATRGNIEVTLEVV